MEFLLTKKNQFKTFHKVFSWNKSKTQHRKTIQHQSIRTHRKVERKMKKTRIQPWFRCKKNDPSSDTRVSVWQAVNKLAAQRSCPSASDNINATQDNRRVTLPAYTWLTGVFGLHRITGKVFGSYNRWKKLATLDGKKKYYFWTNATNHICG